MKKLVSIGGLNWGLIGIAGLFGWGNWNVVNLLLGSVGWLENLVYVLVGIAAVMTCMPCKGKCNKKGGTCDSGMQQEKMDHSHSDHHQG